MPPNQKFVIKSMTVSNPTANAAVLVVRGTTQVGGDERALIVSQTVKPSQTYLCPEVVNQVFDAATLIRASGDGLEFTLSGALIT